MIGHLFLALGLGILAGVVRLVLIFFPVFNVPEAAMFMGLGAFLGYRRPKLWWLSALVLVIPAYLFVILTLLRLGWASVMSQK